MRRYVARGTKLRTVMILVLTALVLPLVAAAQRPAQVRRIAFLGLNSPSADSQSTPFLDAFRHGLRERGWVEGHNFTIEWRWAEGRLERFATLVAELVRLPVEVLVVPNAQNGQDCQGGDDHDPHRGDRRWHLAWDWARREPGAAGGGNVTGLTTMTTELTLTHLELLKERIGKTNALCAPWHRSPGFLLKQPKQRKDWYWEFSSEENDSQRRPSTIFAFWDDEATARWRLRNDTYGLPVEKVLSHWLHPPQVLSGNAGEPRLRRPAGGSASRLPCL